MRILLPLSLLVTVYSGQDTLDCPLRQIGLDYAMHLQSFRSQEAFQEIADAFNGAVEARNCSIKPNGGGRATTSRALSYDLPIGHVPMVFVDPRPDRGNDEKGDGSISHPLHTIEAALRQILEYRSKLSSAEIPQAAIILREGVFYLSQTLQLNAEHSQITFQAYPGEQVAMSGGQPISGVTWQQVTPPKRAVWEYRQGTLDNGFNAAPSGMYTIADAQTKCAQTPTCTAFTYASTEREPTKPVEVYFKYETFFSATSKDSTYVLNRGYLPGNQNLYVADVSKLGLKADITGLRVRDQRNIRARYPNAKTVEQMDAMQIIGQSWTKQPFNKEANYTFELAQPRRNDTTSDYFQTFRLGVGGNCAFRFTPAASYWCSNNSQGGGPGPYSAPVGLVVSNEENSLPHTPYTGNISRALVHSWRAGRWFSWIFSVDKMTHDEDNGQTTFDFSLKTGGNQGSRGGDEGQEFFLENVLDELDSPGEWYYDEANSKLYLWYNGTEPPPTDASIVATQLTVLVNYTGTVEKPVTNIKFSGITFRDTSPNYLAPHGTPSGGDWAVGRSAAVFFENSAQIVVEGCYFTTLDGNALFFSGFARNVSIVQNEFFSIGETAISQWGYTNGSPVPGMGNDATAGTQPRGTQVLQNLVHEVGIFAKQNSFYFQSESFGNHLEGNVAYNGPRAGVNFDDGMGGGSVLTRNVLFNMCRESSDHAPFNSWDRQVYKWDGEDGKTTIYKKNDTISYNFILGNYHSSMAVDNDDGSCFFDTHHNVLIAAPSGAAYGGDSLKSDFGGHSNFHHDNLDLFWDRGFGICDQLEGFSDGYYSNYLWLSRDGPYGNGQACKGQKGETIVFNNTIWSPSGAITECGVTLKEYQAKGGDPGTVGQAYPKDTVVLDLARQLLGL